MAALGGGLARSDESGGGGDEGDARFDASQYAFFGGDMVEEVELGGLEDEEDTGNDGVCGLEDEDYRFSYHKNELEGNSDLSSDVEKVADTFLKLNSATTNPKHPQTRVDAFSGESWTQELESSFWSNQFVLDDEQVNDGINLRSLPDPSNHFGDSRLFRTSSDPQHKDQKNQNSKEPISKLKSSPLHRTSSYPQQEHPQSPSRPISVPNASYLSYPLHGSMLHSSPNSHQTNMSSPPAGRHIPFTSQNAPAFVQFSLPGMSRGLPFSENVSRMGPSGFPMNNRQNQLVNSSHFPNGGTGLRPNLMQQSFPQQDGLMQPRMFHSRQHGMLQHQPSTPHLSHLQKQMLGPQHSPPQMMNRFDAMLGMSDLSDPRFRQPAFHGRPGPRFLAQGSDFGRMRVDNGWPWFRFKYMTIQEIENIARMQQAATHCTDPYIDDYYHQACLARRSLSSGTKHHFCPSMIRDPSSREHAKDEPHAYLHVEALGRLPFSNIRRPRPLLDVEQTSPAGDSSPDQKPPVKPLDEEPLLAARITIEDCLCILLDVDDIDRLLQFSQQQDGGEQLMKRRHTHLEQVAESLQFVDPLGQGMTGSSVGFTPQDDRVFVRIVSLPKGRKLLAHYIDLIPPGSELARIVCMAIFRHLRFIFGSLPVESSTATYTRKNLANAVSNCVNGMELSALSACLAAIVCSVEQTPLDPLGYAAGDGASVIVKCVLDRATELLTNQHLSSSYNVQIRALWQASFDAFFQLLTNYCMSKFDSLVQSVQMHAPAATAMMSKEMLVELLRASLPHTNEQQRKVLLEFAQRSVPVDWHGDHPAGADSTSVPS